MNQTVVLFTGWYHRDCC